MNGGGDVKLMAPSAHEGAAPGVAELLPYRCHPLNRLIAAVVAILQGFWW